MTLICKVKCIQEILRRGGLCICIGVRVVAPNKILRPQGQFGGSLEKAL